MGHRANFVVIRNGQAEAYMDQWAALGCVYALDGGPDAACKELAEFKRVDGLLDWAFAEAGYLIDFDEKKAIAFGCAEDLSEFSEDEDDNDAPPRAGEPFTEGGLPLLQHIGRNWKGWTLVWDDHGVDAFAAHLRKRSITDVAVEPDSYPPETEGPIEYQA